VIKSSPFSTPLLSLVLATGLLFGLTPAAWAEDSKIPKKMPAPFTEDQRGAMEDFVRDFILDNPEVLMESVNRYQEQQTKKREEDAQNVLKSSSDFLFKNPQLPEAGNPKGDVAVVEFFDFNCGYCKRAFEAVLKTIEEDKNVRMVFVDLPILSPQSKTASQWALAAAKQGKYFEFHKALMMHNGPKNDEALAEEAKKLGLDVEKLKKDAASPDVEAILTKNSEFAQKLGISGTPGFILGDQIVRGFVEYDGFKALIAAERAKKTATK
jgi:protein-disulfide isomerase